MSVTYRYFWGVDCGSSEIKVVACDGFGKILYQSKRRTLFPLVDHVKMALAGDGAFEHPFDIESGAQLQGHHITITGYGRSHIALIPNKLTEIKAHFLGVESQMGNRLDPKRPYTIIDIGGQDSKVITVYDGAVQQFIINRKCAAGTGAFIEELAHRLELGPDELPEIQKRHDRNLTLNSYCTVFAGTEMIKILMNGEKVENLIHALYESVARRVLEMTAIVTDTVVFSGGVLHYHPPLHSIFKTHLGGNRDLILAPNAQFIGAIGAAIHGIRRAGGKDARP